MTGIHPTIARELRHLIALAHYRHFGRAADALGLTQPALSKSVRRLEALYRVKLMDRGRNGVSLTPAGEIVLRHSRFAEREMHLAAEQVGSTMRGETGVVVLGASTSMAYQLVPRVSARFLAVNPRVRIRVVTGLNDTLFADLRRGDVDLVVSPLPAGDGLADLSHEPLFQDKVLVVVRRGHPLTRLRAFSLDRLESYSWVLYGPEVLSTQYLNAAFVAAGRTPPTPLMQSDSADYNKEILRTTDLLGYLPKAMVNSPFDARTLVTLPIRRLTWLRTVGLTFRQRTSLSPSAAQLADALRSAAARMP